MLMFKGTNVSKEWVLKQFKEGKLTLKDLPNIVVYKEEMKPKKKQEPVKVIPLRPEDYPFNRMMPSIEEMKGKKLFGCTVRDNLVRLSLVKDKPYLRMVEIPPECVGMPEREVIKEIRKAVRYA